MHGPAPRPLNRPGGAAVDNFRFDHLAKALASPGTRRASLGLFAASLLGLTSIVEDTTAKKRKHRKKRHKKHGGQPGGQAPGQEQCHLEGISCTTEESCCSGSCDFLVKGGTCAPCRGRSCDASRPCCGGQVCTNGYCGGCRDRATSCTANTDCCFTSGACLSAQGGRCARDVDCHTCYLGHNCNGACVNGTCAI